MPAVVACCLTQGGNPTCSYVTSIIARQDKGNIMQPDGCSPHALTPPPAGCTAGPPGFRAGSTGWQPRRRWGRWLRRPYPGDMPVKPKRRPPPTFSNQRCTRILPRGFTGFARSNHPQAALLQQPAVDGRGAAVSAAASAHRLKNYPSPKFWGEVLDRPEAAVGQVGGG